MKKFLAAMMTATLVLGAGFLPAAEDSAVFDESGVITASAAEVSGDYNYVVQDDGTVEITRYTGEGGDVTIPGTIDGNSVTSIDDSAFRFCESLTGITIPDSVTSIGDFAFEWCSRLTSITVPDGVASIGERAFGFCESLTSINVSNNKNYISKDGVLFDRDMIELVAYPCGNARTTYSIPASVTSIGDHAFDDCSNLTGITIPDSVTSIGDHAFGCSNLTGITIPDSVTSIGDHAFDGCSNLTGITIPDYVTSIGTGTFEWCNSLTSINVSNNKNYTSKDGVLFDKDVTELIAYPCGNARTTYSIPTSVTSIGDSAFFGCESLTGITIPDSVTSIGEEAFFNCANLKDVYFEGSEEQWYNIGIYNSNECLTYATIHFNSSKHQHTYSTKWTVDKAATCKATGSKSHHCTKCGAKKDITSIPKTAHKYSWKTIKKATSKANGKQQGKCLVCGKTTTREIISLARTKISVSNKTYTGKQIKPSVTVTYGKTKLRANTDYTITYGTNKAIGKGTVTITGKGKYVGKVTNTFKILPRKKTIS